MMLYWEDLKNQKAYLQETSVARALFFKRAIATVAVLAALSWEAKEPAPVNNFNTNNIEVVEQTNTVNYEIEEVTQSNNYYNYIKNIMPSVNKYFPEYSNYFRNVLSKFNDYGTAEKYLINKRINRDLKTYWKYWELTSDKDKIATALIVFDYLEWDSKFIKDSKINHKNPDWSENTRIEAATWILKWIKREYDWLIKSLNEFEIDAKRITKIVNTWVNERNINDIFDYNEKNMKKFKEYIIDAWIIKESQTIQERIKSYIKLLNLVWKNPSEIGKIYINEYNKIKE